MKAVSVPIASARGLRYRWVCFTVLCMAFVMAYFTRYATAVIVSDLRADFQIDTAGIALIAAAYFYPYALMQPVAGLLADSLGPRWSVSGFLLLAVAGTVIFATATAFPVALLGRVIGGLGVATIYVSGTKFIAHWFRSDEFGPVTGLFAAAGNLGGLTAAGPLAALIAALGWRQSFLAAAAALLITVGLVALVVRDRPEDVGLSLGEPLTGAAATERNRTLPLMAGLRLVLRTPNTWLLGTYCFVMLGILASMQGLWTVPYLRDTYGMSRQAASNILSMWAIGLIVAMPAWGFIADRLVRGHRRTILASLPLHALVWLLLIVRTSGLPVPLLYVLVLYAGFTNGCWIPAYAQLKGSVPAAVVGTAMGIANFAFFAGGAVFQQVTGIVIGALTPAGGHAGVATYRTLFAFFLVALVAAFVAVACSRDASRPIRQPKQVAI